MPDSFTSGPRPLRIDWGQVSSFFVDEGSLRDLYATPASRVAWQLVLDAIKGAATRQWTDPPDLGWDADRIFELRAAETATLRATINGIQLSAFFFVPDEIELSFDPAEVASRSAWERLMDTVELLASASGLNFRVCYENEYLRPIASYSPASRQWHLGLADR